MKATLSFIFFLFISLTLVGQDKLANYKRSKTLIGYGNYEEAMNALKPYLNSNEYGGLSNFATYHYAFAAFQGEQFDIAENMLTELINKGDFSQTDEAKYLLALTYFKKNQPSNALRIINSIKDSKIAKEAENASFEFLKNADIGTFKGDTNQASNNQGFNLAYLNHLQNKGRLTAEERVLIAELTEKISNQSLSINTSKDSEYLDIAIILPFNQSGGQGVQNLNANNFIFELYQGISFAVEELKKRNHKIRIQSFDTERKAEKINQILREEFVLNSDIIIGPIYPEEVEIVATFSETYRIPFINPLSNIDDRIRKLNYAYLFRPSIEQLSNGIIEFINNNTPSKSIALAYSGSTRDELLAKDLEEKIKKEGLKLKRSQKVANREILSFFENLTTANDSIQQSDLLIIISDDPNTANATVGFMEFKNIDTPVLVMDSWLYFNFANYEMLDKQNFYFIGNNPIKLNSSSYDRFREDFLSKNFVYPSLTSSLGYEMLYFIHAAFNQSKSRNWREGLDKLEFYEGKVTYGFDFKKSFSNTYVPVFRLENGTLEPK